MTDKEKLKDLRWDDWPEYYSESCYLNEKTDRRDHWFRMLSEWIDFDKNHTWIFEGAVKINHHRGSLQGFIDQVLVDEISFNKAMNCVDQYMKKNASESQALAFAKTIHPYSYDNYIRTFDDPKEQEKCKNKVSKAKKTMLNIFESPSFAMHLVSRWVPDCLYVTSADGIRDYLLELEKETVAVFRERVEKGETEYLIPENFILLGDKKDPRKAVEVAIRDTGLLESWVGKGTGQRGRPQNKS